MTHEELLAQISTVAEAARAEGQYVEIDNYLSTVLVHVDEDEEYFFQEWAADDLLKEVPEGIDPEDYILWSAQNW